MTFVCHAPKAVGKSTEMKEQSAWDWLDDTSRRKNLMLKIIGNRRDHGQESQAAVGVRLTNVSHGLWCGEGADYLLRGGTNGLSCRCQAWFAPTQGTIESPSDGLSNGETFSDFDTHSENAKLAQPNYVRCCTGASSLAPQRDKLVIIAVSLDNSFVPGGCFLQSNLSDLCRYASLIFSPGNAVV